MNKTLIAIIVIILIAVPAFFVWQYLSKTDTNNQSSLTTNINQETITTQDLPKVSDEDKVDDMEVEKQLVFSHKAILEDVSGGTATGFVEVGINEGVYGLLAMFNGLPEPANNFFYEGWVVRNNPLSVISTGKAVKIDNGYTNVFNSDINLLDHDFYVLTIEPDDGDSAPADHILEGTLSQKSVDNQEEVVEQAPETKTFNLTGMNFTFSQKEIRVNKGDKVKIVFTSTQGFHDWVVDEFGAATQRVNTDGITSVEFIADKTGTFEFYCSVGSHRALGMIGSLIVQ